MTGGKKNQLRAPLKKTGISGALLICDLRDPGGKRGAGSKEE